MVWNVFLLNQDFTCLGLRTLCFVIIIHMLFVVYCIEHEQEHVNDILCYYRTFHTLTKSVVECSPLALLSSALMHRVSVDY